MDATFMHLNPQYRNMLTKRWKDVIDLDESNKITDRTLRENMAIMIQNTHDSFGGAGAGMFSETYDVGAMGAGDSTADGGGPLGTSYNPVGGPGDFRVPQVVMPILRRVFPNLLANDLVGVQPMHGPVGLAFAIRHKYGKFGKGGAAEGDEIGYDSIDSGFTGTTGAITAGDDWAAFAGAGSTYRGSAATMEDAEWWRTGEDMPMAKLGLEKGVVVAGSRKFGTSYSLEMAEDLMRTQGLDVDSEMVQILGDEVKAEIDRELLERMVHLAIGDADAKSIWDPTTADGRSQLERISTLYTHVLQRANKIATRTRVGSGNWMVGDSDTMALIERIGDFTQDAGVAKGGVIVDGTVTSVGTLRNGRIKAYRDIFAGGNYILQGYKGAKSTQTGVVYCPYVPIQLLRATESNGFNPRLAVRTRYGMLDNLFGASKYYQFTRVDNLTGANLAAETARYFSS